MYANVRLVTVILCIVVPPSSRPGDSVITPHFVFILVWHHVNAATRSSRLRPRARKVLCTVFYLEIKSAVDFINRAAKYPSSKYVFACDNVQT